MKLTPQNYQTSTLADAVAAGCDLVQPKYSGQWCRVEISRGDLRVYDEYRETLHTGHVDHAPCCTLIGSFFGPPRFCAIKVIVWDCWALCYQPEDAVRLEDKSLETFSYRDRVAFMRQQVQQIGAVPWLTVIKNFPVNTASDLWESPNAETNGLVFRRSRDPVGATLFVARKYKEVPGGLQ